MALNTLAFTLDSGCGLLGVAGLQIKGVPYYLRLKSLLVTCSLACSYGQQAATELRIRVGNIPKQGACGTRRQLSSPDSHGHQSRVFYYRERSTSIRGALTPRRQEPKADPQLPDYIESGMPSQAMLYHRYAQAGSMAVPWRHSACPQPNLLRR